MSTRGYPLLWLDTGEVQSSQSAYLSYGNNLNIYLSVSIDSHIIAILHDYHISVKVKLHYDSDDLMKLFRDCSV